MCAIILMSMTSFKDQTLRYITFIYYIFSSVQFLHVLDTNSKMSNIQNYVYKNNRYRFVTRIRHTHNNNSTQKLRVNCHLCMKYN